MKRLINKRKKKNNKQNKERERNEKFKQEKKGELARSVKKKEWAKEKQKRIEDKARKTMIRLVMEVRRPFHYRLWVVRQAAYFCLK